MRHVYFYDHPVEFAIMNAEAKWYISLDELYKYLKMHPDFKRTEQKFDAINRAQTLYDEISAGVHGRRVTALETRAALEKIAYEPGIALVQIELIKRSCEASNFLLAIRNRLNMRNFATEERRVILRTLPKEARKVWSEFE